MVLLCILSQFGLVKFGWELSGLVWFGMDEFGLVQLKDCRHRSTRVVGCYIVGGTCSLDGVDTPVTFLLSKHGAGDIRVWCW